MLRSLSGLANIGNVMKQAQEMGAKMQAVGERLKTLRATGQAGGCGDANQGSAHRPAGSALVSATRSP